MHKIYTTASQMESTIKNITGNNKQLCYALGCLGYIKFQQFHYHGACKQNSEDKYCWSMVFYPT